MNKENWIKTTAGEDELARTLRGYVELLLADWIKSNKSFGGFGKRSKSAQEDEMRQEFISLIPDDVNLESAKSMNQELKTKLISKYS